MTDSDNADGGDIGKFDPVLTQRLMAVMRPVLKTYFRSEVHGLDSFPPGGALVVGNHSGGMFPMDVPIFSAHFYDKLGYDRPVYTLSHDILMTGPTADFFRRTGYIRANRENAAVALRSGGVVIVFPAATTTSTGPRCRRTSSTSTAARATSAPRSTPASRSCPRCRSAGRRRSST